MQHTPGIRMVLRKGADVSAYCGIPGIKVDDSLEDVTYVELLYASYQAEKERITVMANGNLHRKYRFDLADVVQVQDLSGARLCRGSANPALIPET